MIKIDIHSFCFFIQNLLFQFFFLLICYNYIAHSGCYLVHKRLEMVSMYFFFAEEKYHDQ